MILKKEKYLVFKVSFFKYRGFLSVNILFFREILNGFRLLLCLHRQFWINSSLFDRSFGVTGLLEAGLSLL